GGRKGAIAVAQQHSDVVAMVVCDGDVEAAVAVDIAHGHGTRSSPGVEVAGGLESTIPVAHEHADASSIIGETTLVRHNDVGDAVAVDIPHRYEQGQAPGGVADRRMEGAVALAQEHAYAATDQVITTYQEVESTVAIDIRHGHGAGIGPGWEIAGGLERAVPVTQ